MRISYADVKSSMLKTIMNYHGQYWSAVYIISSVQSVWKVFQKNFLERT